MLHDCADILSHQLLIDLLLTAVLLLEKALQLFEDLGVALLHALFSIEKDEPHSVAKQLAEVALVLEQRFLSINVHIVKLVLVLSQTKGFADSRLQHEKGTRVHRKLLAQSLRVDRENHL